MKYRMISGCVTVTGPPICQDRTTKNFPKNLLEPLYPLKFQRFSPLKKIKNLASIGQIALDHVLLQETIIVAYVLLIISISPDAMSPRFIVSRGFKPFRTSAFVAPVILSRFVVWLCLVPSL